MQVGNVKSMFSVNTNATVLAQQTSNPLHEFYEQLLHEEYPQLSKILFLQLVLRENVLIYSSRRAEFKQVWLSFAKKISINAPGIYVVDHDWKVEDIYSTSAQYQRVMLYDLSKLSNMGINYLVNHDLKEVSILLVEHPQAQRQLQSEVSEMFALVFEDNQEESFFEDFLNGLGSAKPKEYSQISKAHFNEAITLNFNQTIENNQEERFFKTYLSLLRYRLVEQHINIPAAKWKRMVKIIHFIGLTKTQHAFKRLSLADCCLVPNALASSLLELKAITKINGEVIVEMAAYYGTQKFIKNMKDHFWIPGGTRKYFSSIAEKMSSTVSYFYPCSKYPDTVQLLTQNGYLYDVDYCVSGCDKKLMSDKHFEVKRGSEYSLSLQYRSSSEKEVLLHVGLACFDENRNLIAPILVCRYNETEVIFQSLKGNMIVVKESSRRNLKNWKSEPDIFSYEKCIGVYQDGNIDRILQTDEALSDTDSYSRDPTRGIYERITEEGIILTHEGLKLMQPQLKNIIPMKSALMNHFQGGTYLIAATKKIKNCDWIQMEVEFKGHQRKNNGNSFFLGTEAVRVVLMANYNSGYPDFKVEDKNAKLEFKNIQWFAK